MSRLKAISVARYRSFARTTRLELCPLTLLCGRNNAGKSALLRLLPIIADSVAESARSPLDLTGPAGGRASFLNAHYSGSAPEADEPGIKLSFHWAEEVPLSEVHYLLDFSREDNLTYVREINVRSHHGASLITARSLPPMREQRYEVILADGDPSEHVIPFVGLLPDTERLPADSAVLPVLTEVHRCMEVLRSAIQWLHARRVPPPRLLQASGASPRRMSPDGQEALDILLTNKELRADVAGWYQRAASRDLELQPYSNHFRPLLNPANHRFDIELADTGEGMNQVLPVLVAAAMARRHDQGWPSMIAIEEPESHLHPDAQRALAEHLCALAAEPDPPTIVLETHSNALVLAVQLEAARRRLPPERVCAYWLDSQEDGSSLALISKLDAIGNLDANWPTNIFADERELARELITIQIAAES